MTASGRTPAASASAEASADAAVTVVTAGAADADALSQVIAAAFHDLPPSRWLIPDPGERARIFPGFFRIRVDWALADGTVTTTAGRDAVALWIPAGNHPPSPPAGYPDRLAAVTGHWGSRFEAFDATLEEHHPAGAPHEWLAIIGVVPGRQGRGTGSALLSARHRDLDRDGRPAYLEAASPRARDLYLRHGYALLPGTPFHLPDSGPPMWPMLREARTPG
ncbi:MAG TPA: GNAT family N-acetyltransferase [Streptosporangiaceae bacterium]|nr:GNAT family N-acetyltransferase [Streptosporangiaceae bacterium]